VLFKEVCSDELLKLIKTLQKEELFKDHYLIGGTALSLQIGHRESEDIDLFTLKQQSNSDILYYINKKFKETSVFNNSESSLQVTINGINVDFIQATGKLIDKPVEEGGLKLCSIQDIAGMKLFTINNRTGRKKAKDYVDIAYLIKELSLPVMFNIYKYKYDKDNMFNVKKDLLDVDKINPYTWEYVKMIRKDIFLSDVSRTIKDALKEYNKKYGKSENKLLSFFGFREMECINYYQLENKEFNNVISKECEVELVNDYTDYTIKNDIASIKKFRYVNKAEYFVLQRTRKDNDSKYYKSDIWHFNKNFNEKSALLFMKQFDEKNKMENDKTRNLKFENDNKISGKKEK
jgi:hypothetical protein